MSLERVTQILMLLGDNPHRTFSDINEEIMNQRLLCSNTKGNNSELLIAHVVKKIPEVLKVTPCHIFLGDLDTDLICELEGTAPVYIQVKTSLSYKEKFEGKIGRRRRRGFKFRIVALSFEAPFDETISDFVNQVNALEGRRLLKPVKF